MSPEPSPGVQVTVLERRSNPLLGREEVRFRLEFPGPMVARQEALRALAGSLQVPPERVALRRLEVLYGRRGAEGLARVYGTPEALRSVEPPYLVRRLTGEKRPTAAEAKPAGKKAEKGSEAKGGPAEEKKPPAKEGAAVEKGEKKPPAQEGAAAGKAEKK